MIDYLRRIQINATSGELRLRRGTNDPITSVYQVVNIGSDGLDDTVGLHADSGFVNVTGCAPGTYLLPSLTCTPCPPDTYKGGYGNTACTACHPSTSTNGTFGNKQESDCLCPAGTYTRNERGLDGSPCAPCPDGGLCPSKGMHIEDVLNAPGFWRGTYAAAGCACGCTAAHRGGLCDVGVQGTPTLRCLTLVSWPRLARSVARRLCERRGIQLARSKRCTQRHALQGATDHCARCVLACALSHALSALTCLLYQNCVHGFGHNVERQCSQCSDTGLGVFVVCVGVILVVGLVMYLAHAVVYPTSRSAYVKRRKANLKVHSARCRTWWCCEGRCGLNSYVYHRWR